MNILKLNDNKSKQLNLSVINFGQVIHIKQELIEKENEMFRKMSKVLAKRKIYSNKKLILFKHHEEENMLKAREIISNIKLQNKHLSFLESND